MRQRLFDQYIDGFVIEYIAVMINQAILTVRCERIESDVGDDAHIGTALFDCADCALGKSVRVVSLGGVVGFLLFTDDGE